MLLLPLQKVDGHLARAEYHFLKYDPREQARASTNIQNMTFYILISRGSFQTIKICIICMHNVYLSENLTKKH